ncbi:MAG: ferrochelatase [Actinobacteria bacterium HGW-Actinobacteria-4]|nr:MAG: ferrochelatase [Actinobacteria bacterium HGW-Actinobacteria-4]
MTTAEPGAQRPPLAASARRVPSRRYDAILLTGFGGPEGQDDVIPFLRNVTAGRGIPDERLEEVAHHYRAFGGVSPINQQNRDLQAALQAELKRRGIDLPVYWGNRNWDPYLADTLRDAHANGHTTLLALVTAAFSSYSGCRQYREDLAKAVSEAGLEGQVHVDKIRQYFDHPGFVRPNVEAVRAGLHRLAAEGNGAAPHVMFATHSIPLSAADASGPRETQPDGSEVPGGNAGGWYALQQRAVAELIMAEVAHDFPDAEWSLVYQSRSGSPQVPWLEPDINDAIGDLPGDVTGLVISPLGFVSDHMEVLWDLDTEALATCADRGLPAVRVPTVGIDPTFISGLVDLIEERHSTSGQQEGMSREAMSDFGPWQDICPVDCCAGRELKPVVAAAT